MLKSYLVFQKITLLWVIFSSVLFFVAFNNVHAQVVITEVMYDLPGSDENREWVEVYNTGSESIDLSLWRFNDGSNHVLNTPPDKGGQGSIVLQPFSYAIFTDDASMFLSEHVGYKGTVIDTVLSLKNTSDTISLITDEKFISDSVSYEKTLGGAGDGYSLQKNADFVWVSGSPTPGAQFIKSIIPKLPLEVIPAAVVTNKLKEEVDTIEPSEIIKKEEESVKQEKIAQQSQNTALVSAASEDISPERSNSFVKWFSILIILIVISVAGVMFKRNEKTLSLADEFEIIEEQ